MAPRSITASAVSRPFPFRTRPRGPFPEDVLHRGGTGIPLDGEKARDDAAGVRVEDRDVRPEGDRGDRPGRRSADPGERLERLHRARHLGAVAGDEDPGGPVKVPRAGIVPESLPRLQDGVQRRPGKGFHIGKFQEKTLVVGSDGFDPGLLEHDLRDPDPIRIPGLPPRHRPGRRPEPPQERAGDPHGLVLVFLSALFHKYGIESTKSDPSGGVAAGGYRAVGNPASFHFVIPLARCNTFRNPNSRITLSAPMVRFPVRQ